MEFNFTCKWYQVSRVSRLYQDCDKHLKSVKKKNFKVHTLNSAAFLESWHFWPNLWDESPPQCHVTSNFDVSPRFSSNFSKKSNPIKANQVIKQELCSQTEMFWFCGEEFGSVSLPRHSVNNSHSRCRNLRNDSRENPPKALENNSSACFRDLPSSASCSQMNSLAAKLNNWNLILETRLASLAMIQNHFFLARRLSIKEREKKENS